MMYTKIILPFIVSLFLSQLLFGQIENQNIVELECNTWGAAPIIVEPSYRESDPNLILLNGMNEFNCEYFGSEICVRWLAKDSTIVNAIKIYNPINVETIYLAKSNKICGVLIKVDNIYEESYQTDFMVSVKRDKNPLLYMGLSLTIEPAAERKRNQLKEQLNMQLKNNFNQVERNLISADFSIQSGFSLDAFSFLEHVIEVMPKDNTITEKYWDFVRRNAKRQCNH